MAQGEMELELRNLREQVSMLQQRQEDRDKHWRRCGFWSRAMAVLAVVGALIFLVADWVNLIPTAHQFLTAMGYQLIIMSSVLVLLGIALGNPRTKSRG